MALLDDGLILGAGTRLVRMTGSPASRWLDLEADADRFLALISLVAGRPAPLDSLHHLAAASAFWQQGDKALANLRLAYARLPRLDDPSGVDRLLLAAWLLDAGVSLRSLMEELDLDPSTLDLAKGHYNPQQPRVPAGSGPTSGQWGSGSGEDAYLAPLAPAAAARTGLTFLRGATPAIIERLAILATRFATPTAVLGALLIPTPNSGGVTEGTLPDAPDIAFRKEAPEGRLQITARADDGTAAVVRAENQGGVYVDVATGKPLGRDFGEQMYLDLDSVHAALGAALEAEGKEKPKAWEQDDQPRLCPAPTEDTPHGSSERALDYEDDVHARVNPLAPIPRGFGVKVIDPETGEYVYLDDCFRYAGDLVDGDMRPGGLAEGKGPRTAFLYSRDWGALESDVEQARKQLRAADARGVPLKWYFAEPEAAAIARERFRKEGLGGIIIGVMPPTARR